MAFYPQGADRIISPNELKDLKKEHDTIFNPTSTAIPPTIPTRKRKPLYLLKRIIRGSSSMMKRMLSTPHTENFQRKVHVEIDVPGMGVTSTTVDVFFDIYSSFDHISENCATRFGIVTKSDAVHLIKQVRWHAEEDKNLKEPRLHFNDRKYEEGEFRYVKHLGKFSLVIGWNTIQALKLLEPKDDIAAAGEGFRQLPPSVDSKLYAGRCCKCVINNLLQKISPSTTNQRWQMLEVRNGS
jgi:hypothetical protein